MQEPKRPRGRPPTGRERKNNITIRVTDEEKIIIKSAQDKYNQKSIADLLIHLINK
ncbi:TPA: hypothetical protein ACGO3A_002232 [Streptococcus suis]